ncbi:hypothetical protein Prudu_013658 [Prunus dulcis]|uniref:Integrase catalytic domain-containing protein n=1 Tax=Prunus dulcis TaxID=3755 RepID=A0A4Y1RGB0_PRUDU|nr:hypothetical protein Prudu_013658 [Prunus dulcis]
MSDIITNEIIRRGTKRGGCTMWMTSVWETHDIIHETTCPQTPQQNSVAERKNRHLLETARALLIRGHVPRHHWDDVVVTAIHLINHMPSGVLNFKTLLQVLARHGPLLFVLVLTPRIFGCMAFVHLHKNQRSKLDPCALRCRTYVTLDVTFLESEMFFYDPASNSTLQGEILSEELNRSNLENEDVHLCTKIALGQETITIDHPESGTCQCSLPNNDRSPNPCESVFDSSHTPADNSEQQDEDPPLTQQCQRTNLLRISVRQNRGKPPNRYSPDIGKTSKYPIANHVSTDKLSEPLKAFVHQLSTIHIPTKVSEALKDPKWVQAIKEAMKALKKN